MGSGQRPFRWVEWAILVSSGVLPQQGMGADKRSVDIANAAIFLFSPAAQYISGAVVVVDGAAHHVSTPIFPYPDAVLYPENIKEFKARL